MVPTSACRTRTPREEDQRERRNQDREKGQGAGTEADTGRRGWFRHAMWQPGYWTGVWVRVRVGAILTAASCWYGHVSAKARGLARS